MFILLLREPLRNRGQWFLVYFQKKARFNESIKFSCHAHVLLEFGKIM